ncbi:MAG: hypothetical protein BJ554DRAFT_5037, partial [Olpidium bornovanus]
MLREGMLRDLALGVNVLHGRIVLCRNDALDFSGHRRAPPLRFVLGHDPNRSRLALTPGAELPGSAVRLHDPLRGPSEVRAGSAAVLGCEIGFLQLDAFQVRGGGLRRGRAVRDVRRVTVVRRRDRLRFLGQLRRNVKAAGPARRQPGASRGTSAVSALRRECRRHGDSASASLESSGGILWLVPISGSLRQGVPSATATKTPPPPPPPPAPPRTRTRAGTADARKTTPTPATSLTPLDLLTRRPFVSGCATQRIRTAAPERLPKNYALFTPSHPPHPHTPTTRRQPLPLILHISRSPDIM